MLEHASLYSKFLAPRRVCQQAAKDPIEKYKHIKLNEKAICAAMVDVVDQGIGRIMESLDRNGYTDNTLLAFHSDNGGQNNANNRPLRGGKGDLTEGGTRVVALPFRKEQESDLKERPFYSFHEKNAFEQPSLIEDGWNLIRRGPPILETDSKKPVRMMRPEGGVPPMVEPSPKDWKPHEN